MKQLLLIGAIQGFIISVALLRTKNPHSKQSNALFSLLILVVSLYLLVVSQNQYFINYPKEFLTAYVLIYLYCPIYYLYIVSIAGEKKLWSFKNLIYFTPAIIFIGFMFRYYKVSDEQLLLYLRDENVADLFLADLASILMNFYLLWASWKIIRYWKQEPVFQNTGIGVFLIFQGALIITNIVWFYFLLKPWIAVGWALPFGSDLVYLSMSGLIFMFSYILIAKNEYFFKLSNTPSSPYQKVTFQDDELNLISEKVIYTLQSSRAYCDAEFSLGKLSILTDIDKFKLSYTINHRLDSSFTRLVNTYRIEEFLDLIRSNDYSHYNMLGIANEAGFKTKSTFFKAFKEIKGETPREYLKRIDMDNQGNLQSA